MQSFQQQSQGHSKSRNLRRLVSLVGITGVLCIASVESGRAQDIPRAPILQDLQEKVDLEYRNAPVMDVIRSIAQTAKLNVAFSKDVTNLPVNIFLNNVTYDVALQIILDMYGLGVTREHGVLQIDTKENISKEIQQKNLARKEIWKSEPTRQLFWQVNYAKAATLVVTLKEALKAYASDDRLSIQADVRTNKIMVEGVPSALMRAKTILQNLDKRKREVLIEARIVEASNKVSKSFGVSWGGRFGAGGNNGVARAWLPNNTLGSFGGAGSVSIDGRSGGAIGSTPGTMGLSFGTMSGMINIDAILRAYEQEDLANIIASQRVVVQDQDLAHIDETDTLTRPSILLPGANGAVQQTPPRTSKVSLDVTPQITSDNNIELEISMERDTPLTPIESPVDNVVSRKAKTKLTVRNGDTAVVGGLYQTLKRRSQERIPILGKLPLIGFLFRSSTFDTERTELLVMITPRIMPQNGQGDILNASGDLSQSPLSAPALSPITDLPPVNQNRARRNAVPSNIVPKNNLARNNAVLNNTAPNTATKNNAAESNVDALELENSPEL